MKRSVPGRFAARLILLLLLAGFAVLGSPPSYAAAAGAATRLVIGVPASAVAGTPISVTVTAKDAASAVATGYRGRVSFTSTDPRTPALPAAYTFTAADHGVHTFTGVVLHTAGTVKITATTVGSPAVKGTSPGVTVGAGPAARIAVSAPTAAAAGEFFDLVVTVKDAFYNRATGYLGTVVFSTNDPRGPIWIAAYGFSQFDRGVHTFPGVQLRGAGARTITVADSNNRSITGTANVSVSPGAATRFAVQAPGAATSGSPFDLVVTAKDPYFNIVSAYRGTVALTSTDASAHLPAPFTFTAADRGTHKLAVVLNTAGGRTITATDAAAASVTGTSALITVEAHYGLYGWPGTGPVVDGNIAPSVLTPQAFAGSDTQWAKVSYLFAHAAAIKTDGTLWTWGLNSEGQLGDGTDTTRSQLVQLGTSTWTWASAGLDYTAAVKSDGTLWTWGEGSGGKLGDGDVVPRWTPVQVGTDTHWASVEAGFGHTVAVKTDGTLWAWGANAYGALGDGTTTDRRRPVQIGTDTHWASVDAGYAQTVAVKTDGTLWAWGSNVYGQLGDGTTTDRSAPTRVGTDNQWVAASVNFGTTVALKADGSLWAWGDNTYGQVGDGTTTNRSEPTRVGADNHWLAASAGHDHTVAVAADGTIWSWGNDGDGPTTAHHAPIQIGTNARWVTVAAGFDGTLALGH